MSLKKLFLTLFIFPIIIFGDPVTDPSKKDLPAKDTSIITTIHKYAITNVCKLDGSKDNFDIDEYVCLTVSDTNNIHALDSLYANYKVKTKDLVIWLNGIAFSNLNIISVNPQKNEVIFKLQCDTCKKSPWKVFYDYSSRRLYKLDAVPLKIQLGVKDKPITTESSAITIKFREFWMKVVGYVSMFILLVFFIYLVKYHGILRDYMMFDETVDITNKLDSTKTNQVLLKTIPYSLARTQLSFWTLLVSFSFVFIWLNLDELAGINNSIIILLGISGGTSIVAKIIDSAHNIDKVCISADQFTATMKSKGFLNDLLSDEKGISIHRFQLVTFTFGLGIYFVWQVIYNLEMPEFSSTLLLLIGVSSTTYAGIKFNEK